MNWSLYDDNGMFAADLSENTVREYLANPERNTNDVYAMNETGDVIESADGPITVARVKDESND